jgi:hypothetical protein
MRTKSNVRRLFLVAFGMLAALNLASANLALAHGGGGGGHGGGGGYGGGHGGGGYGGHGGFGGRGGRRGGFGGRGFYDGFYGLGLGLYFATLPYYYSTYWWGGIPYYYADDAYYRWDGGAGQYQWVKPPPEVQKQAESQAITNLISYPKNGQSAELQAQDKSDCQQWAVAQVGYSPTPGKATTAPDKRVDYLRAQAACLEGRGYSVR